MGNIEIAITALRDKLKAEQEEFKKLEAELKEKQFVLTSLQASINSLSGNPPNIILNGNPVATTSLFNYDTNWSWKEKIAAYIKYRNKVVLTNEVVDAICDNEATLNYNQVFNMVAGNISNMAKEGVLKKFKPSKMKGFYYGIPTWFDENDNLKPEYEAISKKLSIWE